MIYLNDIYYRLFYSFISACFLGSVLYSHYNEFLLLSILPTYLTKTPLLYLIFIEPKEVFFLYLYNSIFWFVLFFFQYIIYNILDFLKPGLYEFEKNKLFKLLYYYMWSFNGLNIIILFTLMPLVWSFFSSFFFNDQFIQFFIEISAINYFNYFYSFMVYSNIIFILFLILIRLFFKLFNKIQKIIMYKSYIIILLICFSTLVTPPTVDWQILLFAGLYIFLEFCLYFLFIFFFYKQIKILQREPIERI